MAWFPCVGGEDIPVIAPDYDSTVTYNKEDVVLYNGITYICNTDGTTGTWNSTYWTKCFVADLTQYNSNLGGKAIIEEFEDGVYKYYHYAKGTEDEPVSFTIPKTGSYAITLRVRYFSSLTANVSIYCNNTIIKTFNYTSSFDSNDVSYTYTFNADDKVDVHFTGESGTGGGFAILRFKLNS